MEQIINQLISDPVKATKWRKTNDGFLRCTVRVLKGNSILEYSREELEEVPGGLPEKIRMFVPLRTLKEQESLGSVEGAPIVTEVHNWLTPENVSKYAKGAVAGTPIVDADGYLSCDLLVTDPESIRQIESEEISEISGGYTSTIKFIPGEWEGQPYDATQYELSYNHIAIIPEGTGRAGKEVRILNKEKGIVKMDPQAIRVKLYNGKLVDVSEEVADAIEEDVKATGMDIDSKISAVEEKKSEIEALQEECKGLQSELLVYKEKLEEALNGGVEAAAEAMNEETEMAVEIVENIPAEDKETEEDLKNRKQTILNSIHKVHGEDLQKTVLTAVGLKIENMSKEELKGAFKAHSQFAKMGGGKTKTVVGSKMLNTRGTEAQKRTDLKKILNLTNG